MIVDINKKWRLKTDPMNWIVEEKVGTRKKRKSEGREDRWKARAYFSSYWKALGFMMQHDLRCMEGHFPPSALEPLAKKLNDLETLVEDFEKRSETAFKDVPGIAKARSPQKMHIYTPANENALALKKKRKG